MNDAGRPAGSLLGSEWAIALDPGRRDGRIVAEGSEAARKARPAGLPASLHHGLRDALTAAGIKQLYSHQLRAYELARAAGEARGIIVTTSTASGKSLAFNLPVLDSIAHDGKARALYLYPTKALAQDQARKLTALGAPNLRPALYDGDTPKQERPAIRRRANLVLTNPDMLHVGVMPHHRGWGDFLANLGWIVLDEAHVYRGVFGSHIGQVLRRLRRLARAYGAEPRFLATSATIANPVELAENLTGLEFDLIDEDGSPAAGRDLVLWNPPLINAATGARRSPLSEAADLVAELVTHGVRTICFLRSRRGIELIQRFTRENLERRGRPELAARVAPYRAGYTPQQRRELERRLVTGELSAVIATNALELGIDIGELDASICVTFPGTVAGLRQMWGRAGRRSRGLAVFIAGADALDQFFCRHPDEFLDRPVEAARVNFDNERIAAPHLVAAAHELPITADDEEIYGPGLAGRVERLTAAGELRRIGGKATARRSAFAAGGIPLRSASVDNIAVVEQASGEMLGVVEAERAFSTLHPGAVYLHLGRAYEVELLDIDTRQAMVNSAGGEWFTRPKLATEIYIERVLERTEIGPGGSVALHHGVVSVTEQVIAFQRVSVADQEPIDTIELELPEQSFESEALWYTLPDQVTGGQSLPRLLGALHAAEHAQIAVLPLQVICDRWDIGGLSTNIHFQTGLPTVFIYEGHPGGVGIVEQGYREFDALLARAIRLIDECPCAAGCPSCVQSPKCGNLNEPLHKQGALEVMQAIKNRAGPGVRRELLGGDQAGP